MTSSIATTILTDIWGLVYSLLQSLFADISQLIGDATGGFGNSIVTMFNNWASSLYGIGIWEPVMFVVVIGVSGALIYLFFDAYGIEKDVVHGEEDL